MTGQQERVRRSQLSKTPWDISSQGHKSQASAFMRRWPFPVAEN